MPGPSSHASIQLSPAREAGEYLFHQLLYRDLLAGLSASQ